MTITDRLGVEPLKPRDDMSGFLKYHGSAWAGRPSHGTIWRDMTLKRLATCDVETTSRGNLTRFHLLGYDQTLDVLCAGNFEPGFARLPKPSDPGRKSGLGRKNIGHCAFQRIDILSSSRTTPTTLVASAMTSRLMTSLATTPVRTTIPARVLIVTSRAESPRAMALRTAAVIF